MIGARAALPSAATLGRMNFEMDVEYDGDARVQDVVQEAVDATATTYTRDADVDVEAQLRLELADRGARVGNEAWLRDTAREIRAGHHVTVSGPGEDLSGDGGSV